VFSAIDLMLVAGADEIGDRQETRATEPMLKAARYSRLPAGSPITKNAHMCRYGRVVAEEVDLAVVPEPSGLCDLERPIRVGNYLP
jgi:hypothetical protein